MVQETTEKVIQIKQRIQAARDRQKSYADLKRKPMEFQVGDRVMLNVSPWKGVKKCYSDESLAVLLEGLYVDDKLHFCGRTCRDHGLRSQKVEAKSYPNCQGSMELKERS
ncbi:hypothetical protein Tco_1074647 [Tanacetum coccineum]